MQAVTRQWLKDHFHVVMFSVISHFFYKLWLTPELWLAGVPLSSHTSLICPPSSLLKTSACSYKSHTRLTVRSLLTLPLSANSFSYCVVSAEGKGRLLMLQGAGKNQHHELYLLHRCSQMYNMKSSIKVVWLQNGSGLFFLMPAQVSKCVLHCKKFVQRPLALSVWPVRLCSSFHVSRERGQSCQHEILALVPDVQVPPHTHTALSSALSP